ncbi:MAG: M23 family metallopeptidase [Acidithiobacillus sp.]
MADEKWWTAAGMAGGAAIAATLAVTDPGGVVSGTFSDVKERTQEWGAALLGSSGKKESSGAREGGGSCRVSPEEWRRRGQEAACQEPNVVRAKDQKGKLLGKEDDEATLQAIPCEKPKNEAGWHHCRDYSGIVPGARFASPFGPRNLNDHSYHRGVDLGQSCGTEIHAPYDGIVVGTVDKKRGGKAGNHLVLEHHLSDGRILITRYLHLQDAPDLLPGEIVKARQTIAKVGNTGGKYPCHLHYEESLSRTIRWNDPKAETKDPSKDLKKNIPQSPRYIHLPNSSFYGKAVNLNPDRNCHGQNVKTL